MEMIELDHSNVVHLEAIMSFVRVDFRFMEIEYELWALGQILGLMEKQIQLVQQQDQAQTFAYLREKGWDHDEAEVDLASQELCEKQRYVIPRFVRGPYVVSLWACFEAAILELANYRQHQIGAKLSLGDLRSDTVLKRARRYFEAVLDLPLDQNEARYTRLSDLSLVRNSLAHANGQKHGMSPEAWKLLTGALERQATPPDYDRGFVILSDTYVTAAFEDVNGCVRDLVHRIKGSPKSGRPGPSTT